MTAYAAAVTAGQIIAGPHVRGACRRHLADLENGTARGLGWDIAAANRALRFFPDVLRVDRTAADPPSDEETKRFDLIDWQAFIVGSLFGWKRADGTRRFRMAFVETGKGSGKSPLAAGIGLLMLAADREFRPEVYAAATKKGQAKVLFRDAVSMVDQSPDLSERLAMSGGAEKTNIAYLPKGGFFRPISTEDRGKGQSGPRPHCGLLDEIHEHPTNAMVEMMRAGTKGRRQALILMITNSGSDRNSVCFHYHDYGAKVCSGAVEDDSFFAYICGLDNGGTETYDVDVSIERMASSCNCSAQTTLRDLPKPEGFAAAVTSAFDSKETSRQERSVLSILIDRSFRAAFASTATRSGPSQLTQRIAKTESRPKPDGQKETAINATLRALGIGSERKRKTQHGRPTGADDGSTDSVQKTPPKLSAHRAECAESVEAIYPVRALITAIAQELSEDSSAITAMRDLACSEITSRLYDAHSITCKTRQQYKLSGGKLATDLPVDDPFADDSCWPKANPSLGRTITHRYLEEQVTQARGMPSKQNLVRRLNFCVWTEADSAWLTHHVWLRAERELVLEDFFGRRCALGLDLSYTKDLTALAAVFPDGADRFAAAVDFFKPKIGLREAVEQDNVPYDIWAARVSLTLTEGRVVKLGPVAERIGWYAANFDLITLAYDRYRHRELDDDLADLGIVVPTIEHPQGFRRSGLLRDADGNLIEGDDGRHVENPLWMPDSLLLLENAIVEERCEIAVNPVLRWNVASAVIRDDPAGTGNRVFDKRRATGRIDGVVALAMAVGAAVRCGGIEEPASEPFAMWA